MTLFKIIFLIGLTAANGAVLAADPLRNELAGHSSPYLALHGTDPVAWQDLDAQVFTRARDEKKLVYVSVGYFSCHWCHVMQKESYKDVGIAKVLNQNFIPVKVDRELQPALDERLIDFAERTLGQAGWPLNVFLTPDGHPLYAVLYLPRDNFERVLVKLNEIWRDPVEQVKLRKLAQQETPKAIVAGKAQLDPAQIARYLDGVVTVAKKQADHVHGGFGEQNKFPSAPQLMVLLQSIQSRPDKELKDFLLLTLDHMANNGLYDHLGGGFFRYTVDPAWEMPHFEKMLYDNAQLAQVYLLAADVLQRPDYRRVARETLDFMVRDMLGDRPAMVASFSAVDDQNVEGGYYLFSDAQLIALLTDDERKVAKQLLRMRDAAPFEAGYLPLRGLDSAQIAAALNISSAQVDSLSTAALAKLKQARAKRALPVDTKLLAGWNGLALAALAQAAKVFADPAYRQASQKVRDYLLKVLWREDQLRRAVAGGQSVGQVSLQDYAFVAYGLWHWARLPGNEADIEPLRRIVDQGWRRFHHQGGWRTSEVTLLATAPVSPALSDGVMPSPSALFAEVSLSLSRFVGDAELERRSLRALNTGSDALSEVPFWYATQIAALAKNLRP